MCRADNPASLSGALTQALDNMWQGAGMSYTETTEANPPLTKRQRRALQLQKWFWWVGRFNQIAGLLTGVCVLYLAFSTSGILAAVLLLVFLGFCYRFGVALVFVTAASFLHFTFHAVGLWLPITSYITAISTFAVAVHAMRVLHPDGE